MKTCAAEGCNQKHYGRSYCKPHYDERIRGRNVKWHLVDVPDGHKWCPQCSKAVPYIDFGGNDARSDGMASWCKNCLNKRSRDRYREEGGFNEKHKAKAAVNRARYRAQLIAAYGGKCNCCGDDWEAYLELDHTNGDGSTHRVSVPSVWHDLRKRGYPQEGYQLLCANCHAAKTRRKQCRHM